MMKIVMAKKLIRLALTIPAITLINNMTIQKAYTREVNLDTLCQKFSLNSRCQGYKFSQTKIDRVPHVIKLKLKTSGSDREWIRADF